MADCNQWDPVSQYLYMYGKCSYNANKVTIKCRLRVNICSVQSKTGEYILTALEYNTDKQRKIPVSVLAAACHSSTSRLTGHPSSIVFNLSIYLVFEFLVDQKWYGILTFLIWLTKTSESVFTGSHMAANVFTQKGLTMT